MVMRHVCIFLSPFNNLGLTAADLNLHAAEGILIV